MRNKREKIEQPDYVLFIVDVTAMYYDVVRDKVVSTSELLTHLKEPF